MEFRHTSYLNNHLLLTTLTDNVTTFTLGFDYKNTFRYFVVVMLFGFNRWCFEASCFFKVFDLCNHRYGTLILVFLC